MFSFLTGLLRRSFQLIISPGIAATEPTIGGDARMGVISAHGADIGFGSRINFAPPARRTMALRSAAQSTLSTPVAALQARETAPVWPTRSPRSPSATLPVPQGKQLARQGYVGMTGLNA